MTTIHKRAAAALTLTLMLFAGCKSVPTEKGGTPVIASGSEATSAEENGGAPSLRGEAEAIPTADGKATHDSEQEPPRLTCLFAGDIMAHNVNYRMADYSRIWDGVRYVVSECDLAFANIEMPVDDSRPMSSYPQFNVHSPYVEAAIDAGFNVFSLVNNHTNDQGIEGMDATRKWAERRAAGGEVYFSGLKETALSPMSYAVIERGGYTVLFLAVTEILNSGDYKRNMNYIGVDKASRSSFIDVIKALQSNNPCDIFVLSIHANVTEYVHEIEPSRIEWYKRLAAAGVDVVWANHPHIVQDAEVTDNKIVMFACGNVISGQRSRPQFDAPATERDWTGDGLMMKVVFQKENAAPKDAKGCTLKSATPMFITTYITPGGEYVVRMLDDDTIQSLRDEGRTKWADYLAARKEIMANVPMKLGE